MKSRRIDVAPIRTHESNTIVKLMVNLTNKKLNLDLHCD